MDRDERIREEIAKFPAVFGMKAFPGEKFKISFYASYVSDFPEPNTIYLYTMIKNSLDVWTQFCKGTPEELQQEVVLC